MLDFTSALYLGMKHQSGSLRSWESLTSGLPAALREPPDSILTAQALARLIGCEAGMLVPSTLHAFWDIFGVLGRDNIAIYVDAEAYPIARWGAERAGCKGKTVRLFRHQDPDDLFRQIKKDIHQHKSPVVVTDGFCIECAGFAPIRPYLELTEKFGGILIIDDTQALGVLGYLPSPRMPYGTGGGGVLKFNNLVSPDVIIIDSLAKGFGAPLAVLAGANSTIRRFKDESEIRVHCSPPSLAAIRSAENALLMNNKIGDSLRSKLARLVRYFRKKMACLGVKLRDGLFPVQTLAAVSSNKAAALHHALLSMGVKTVLRRSRSTDEACISFVITCLHNFSDIDQAAEILGDVIYCGRRLRGGYDYRLSLPCR